MISEEMLLKVHGLVSLKFAPEDLGPRKAQLDEITSCLKQTDQRALFLSGNPACGKTTVIRKLCATHRIHYVNAALISAPQQIFVVIYRLLSKSERQISAPKAFEQLRTWKKHVVVVVDEVDYLTRKKIDILYQLLELPQIQYIFAANSLNFLSEMQSQRVNSRVSTMHQIVFPDYSATDFLDILKIRLSKQLFEQLFDPKAAKLLANRAQLQGDLRLFLSVAFRAIDAAKRRGAEMVQAADVQAVTGVTPVAEQFSVLQLLILKACLQPIDRQLLPAKIMQGQGWVNPQDVHALVQELIEDGALSLDQKDLVSCQINEKQLANAAEKLGIK